MLGGSELAARRTSRSSAARMNSCCAATQPNTASSRPEMTRHQSSTNMNSVLCAAGGRGACKATESAHRATSRITNCACACRTLLTDRIQYLYAAHAVACTISRTQTFAPRTTHGARERERESECEAAARHTASKRTWSCLSGGSNRRPAVAYKYNGVSARLAGGKCSCAQSSMSRSEGPASAGVSCSAPTPGRCTHE